MYSRFKTNLIIQTTLAIPELPITMTSFTTTLPTTMQTPDIVESGIALIQQAFNKYENNPVLNALCDLHAKTITGQDGKLISPSDTSAATLSDQDCIIFDMDGTLADNIPPGTRGFPENPELCRPFPIARPGMKEALEYAFANFKHVSIWTAGTDPWFGRVFKTLFEPALPPGKNFHFVKTRNPNEPYVPLKPLTTIYAQYPEYTASNTVIVDDNPETFRENPENAEHITSFFYDLLGKTRQERELRRDEDIELLKLIDRLKLRNREYLKSIIQCVLILLGIMRSDIDSITVPYSALPPIDSLKIKQVKLICSTVSPNLHITTECMHNVLHMSWSGEEVDPIVFDKSVFPDITEARGDSIGKTHIQKQCKADPDAEYPEYWHNQVMFDWWMNRPIEEEDLESEDIPDIVREHYNKAFMAVPAEYRDTSIPENDRSYFRYSFRYNAHIDISENVSVIAWKLCEKKTLPSQVDW